jgi:uncharacterized membrane protein
METNVLSTSANPQSSSIPPATGSSKLNVGQTERIISVVGGTTLSVLAIRNWKSVYGKAFAVLAAILLKRGVTGYCEINQVLKRNTAIKKASAMEVKATFTINKAREEVFSFWRNFENLPTFMKHLYDVEVLDEKRSHWSAKLPGGVGKVSWEAVIEEEEPNSFISWTSLPGSTIDNAGEVRFSDAPRNQGTEVHAKISYRLPAGDVGSLAGKLFNPLVEGMIREDLRRFKSLLETGEIAHAKQDTEAGLLKKISNKFQNQSHKA